jgi:hypothetical protein
LKTETHIQTGASQATTILNTSSLKAELSSFDGSYVSTWTTTNHHHIIVSAGSERPCQRCTEEKKRKRIKKEKEKGDKDISDEDQTLAPQI